MCKVVSYRVDNDIEEIVPWAPTNVIGEGLDILGYRSRGKSIMVKWDKCDEYPAYVPIKEMANRCIDENRLVFDRLAQI